MAEIEVSTVIESFLAATSGTGACAEIGALRQGDILSSLAVSGASTLTGAVSLGGAVAAATTATKLTKIVSAIQDAAPTSVLTVSVPNAASAAAIRVTLMGRLGAGGSVGADEATGCISYDVSVSRVSGVVIEPNISGAYGQAGSPVSGAANIDVQATLSSVSGAANAVNTFTIQVIIARGSGSSNNHKCTLLAEVINGNASGVTIA